MSTPNEADQQPTLLSAYDHDLQQLQQRVGIDRAASTLRRRQQLRRHVACYLTTQLHRPDIALRDLQPSFIADFATFLSTTLRLRGGTVWLACQHLKGVVARACQQGQIAVNPFSHFHIGKNIREREYLTEQELLQLMRHPLSNPRQALYRDLFVFSALTGMAFADICRLRQSDIRDVNGQAWVMARRQKTQTPFYAKLLPQAQAILQRHARNEGPVFGAINYRTLAKHIPSIVQSCGIGRHITFHCARHTFAIMALNAGVPIESISRLLGHTNIATTQIYARITLQKLERDMQHFGDFLPAADNEKS